jgi:hypothetical protein
MVVANIAYKHLDPAVRTKVENLVSYLHQEYPKTGSFIQISFWPDIIRYQKIETFTHWHYIDMPFSTDGTPLADIIDSDNAVWAVNNLVRIVENDDANPYERGRFLAFLVHIVGDLHQPLHTVSQISASKPKGDKGGNMYFVRYEGKRLNLHHIWDEGVGAFEEAATPESADMLGNDISARYPEKYFGERVKDLSPANWAKEGMVNAKNVVYNTPKEQDVSTNYVETSRQLAEQEAALAGYRLAAILNKLLA